jgi:uncharacterized membrane protein YbhN (UPF0104 family)
MVGPSLLLIAAAVGVAIPALANFDRLLGSRLEAYQLLRPLRPLGRVAQRTFVDPAGLVPVAMWAILAQLCLAFSTYWVMRGFGASATLLDCIVFTPLVALIAALPISIGGWGVRESAMIGFFGLVGVPAGSAED